MNAFFPSGDSEDPGPRATRRVLESDKGHGGLLYPVTAQRHGVLHPVCQDAVGGRTHSLTGRLVFMCGTLITVNRRMITFTSFSAALS